MTGDATFEEGGEQPLRLRALDSADLDVISTLVQDSVLPVREIKWDKRRRRLALLLNRFRWEDAERAKARGRPMERVQSVLSIEDVTAVQAQGVSRGDPELVLSVLSVAFEPGEDGTGRVVLTLAGDGAMAAHVEALEVFLQDVTRPYLAPSGKAPTHPES